MCKRFLGIFKRDKRGFSNEELKWQKKMILILFLITIAIELVFILMIKYEIAIIIAVIFGIVSAAYWQSILNNVNEQRNTNREREIKQKILEKIKNEEFSDLQILNEEVIQDLFQECLSLGIIEIIKQDFGMVKITINTNKEMQNKEFFVDYWKKEILEYFNI